MSALTLAARMSFSTWIITDRPILVIYFLPILFSAYVGGLGPGLLATGISAIGANYFLLQPIHSYTINRLLDWVQLLALIGGGVVASILTESLHRARNRAINSQRTYAVTLASIGDAVITTDIQGRINFMNREAERLTGWPYAEAAGQLLPAVFHIISEETRAMVDNPVEKVLRTHGVVGLANHTILIARDGKEWVIDDSAAPIQQQDGTTIGVVLVFRDNSEKMQAETAVRVSEERLRFALETIHTGAWSLNLANHTAYRSLEHSRIFGYDEVLSEWSYEKFLSHVLPEDRALVDEKFKQALQSRGDWSFECRIQRTDGAVRWIWAAGRHHQEAAGAPFQMSGIVQDITERRQREAAFHQSRERLEQVVHQTRCIINTGEVTGPAGWEKRALEPESPFVWNFPVINPEMAQAVLPLELQPDEPYEQGWKRRRWPQDHAQMNLNSGRALLEGSPFYRNEFRCTDRTGKVHWMQQQVTVQKISEGRWQLFGITTDVSELKATEARYQQEHDLLCTLIDLAPDFIFIKDTASRYQMVNRSLAKRYGLSPEAMLGKTDADLLPAELATRFRAGEQKALATESCYTVEDAFTFPNGESCTVVTNMRAFCNPQGKVIGLVGVGRDITRQKTAEQSLRESESRLSTIFHSSPIGIVITRFDGGQVWEANEAFASSLGYPLAEILDGHFNARRLWADPQQRKQLLERLSTQHRCRELEVKMRRKDGAEVERVLSVEIIHLAGEKCLLGLMQDHTERKQAEAGLRRLAAIVNFSEDAIISKTLEGVITSWNHGAEQIFGYPAAEVIGKPLRMLFPPDRQHEEEEILNKISRGENVTHFETVRLRKDGKRINVSVTISPLKDSSGKIIGASKVARDITGLKLLEEQLRHSQKMEAIGQLAGGVAHDFNNILAIIQLQIDLLASSGSLLPAQQDYAEEISKATERAANLTRQLLLFSRKQQPQQRDLNLNDLVVDITKMIQRALGELVLLNFQLSQETLFIHADPGMIDQLLVNLAVNARDAMPNGGRLLVETAAAEFDETTAALVPQARPGAFACLTVSDTGCGIPPQVLPRIFEPFFTTKDIGKGTGLGLATVFGIVQQHHGWINVHSEVGQGASFRIYLPRLAQSILPASATSTFGGVRGGQETILVVEDEAALRNVVRMVLSGLGYKIIEAASGASALDIWQAYRNEIKLMITDLVMPGGVNGKELAQRLLAESPDLKVIYVSGYSADIAGTDLFLQEGVNFLAKPFMVHKLAQTIRNRLDEAVDGTR